MDIWSAIEELINIVEVGTGSSDEDESRLLYLLDCLALEMHRVNPEGGYDGVEIPENDYPAIRKAAEQRFPNWGYYNTPKDVTENGRNRVRLELLSKDSEPFDFLNQPLAGFPFARE